MDSQGPVIGIPPNGAGGFGGGIGRSDSGNRSVNFSDQDVVFYIGNDPDSRESRRSDDYIALCIMDKFFSGDYRIVDGRLERREDIKASDLIIASTIRYETGDITKEQYISALDAVRQLKPKVAKRIEKLRDSNE